jgi:hypothetical protein
MDNKIQFTLTVEEGKSLIAQAVLRHPRLQNALRTGKVVLKGGTTVSKIAELLIGRPLRICGRVTERGTVTSLAATDDPHSVLIEKGEWRKIDDTIIDEMPKLGPQDVIVCGANAIDSNKNAALMVGSSGGGNVGKSLSAWYSEGTTVLIPVGLEKLIPGDLREIIGETGRKKKSLSWGMSVGLAPLLGEVITEIEAVQYLAAVRCRAIGAGGIDGAAGAVTFEAWGEDVEVEKIVRIVAPLKNEPNHPSGSRESLTECIASGEQCARHIGCGYKSGKLRERKRVKIGAVTIGQSPRTDITDDLKRVLGKSIRIIEYGALDMFHYDEVVERFSPKAGETVLVTRMRDGRQVKIAEHHLLPLLQNCLDKLEQQRVKATILLCTGEFPEFSYQGLLLKPRQLLQAVTAKICDGRPVGILVPDEDQIEQIAGWWRRSGAPVEIEAASPYKDFHAVEEAAERLKRKPVSVIFMDCMGYSVKMKERVREITGKPVLLPRTLAARMIEELFGID